MTITLPSGAPTRAAVVPPARTDAPAPAAPTTASDAPIALEHDRFGMPEAPGGELGDVDAVVHLPSGPDDQPFVAGEVAIESAGLHLPAPPKRGGLVERGELKALHVLQDHRTPAGNAWANEMAKGGALHVLWKSGAAYRKDVGFVRGWAGTAVASAAVGVGFLTSSIEKRHFDRDRPWVVDPTITQSVPRPRDASYPSGHTTVAFTAARVFGAFDPDHAGDFYALATKVGASRVYGGVHFPTDVAAGAALGLGVGSVAVHLAPWLAPKRHDAAAPVAAPAPTDAPTPG